MISIVLIVPLWNWNNCWKKHLLLRLSSNRTFMELKSRLEVIRRFNKFVLIVPLWNWNLNLTIVLASWMLVLIVPLWNWNFATLKTPVAEFSSNRTFMELKWHQVFGTNDKGWKVLIVPLWNWNFCNGLLSPHNWLVLIVPLWNWNEPENSAGVTPESSNRTFMELK